ncbi:MAG TPA: cysteine desulfurase family protein [Bdellovibrionota bacterium]|jgi:cysteine desulfurase|nr:cysteine desulfurase family protein [Bdellovibrionota bacterium]
MVKSGIKLPLYLDHQATTPVDAEVFARMAPYFTEKFGNASSRVHEFGWTAEAAVELAREQVAALVGSTPRELVFTGGATESNNLAILGVAQTWIEAGRVPHFVTTAVEHRAVLEPLLELERKGCGLTVLPVDKHGRVTPEQVKAALRPDTALVSVMLANNEVGSLQPVAEIGRVCKAAGVTFHTDAAQAGAWIKLSVDALGVDLLTLSAHKMYGPKGVGALFIRRRDPRVTLKPLAFGGGQERGLRPGTLNVPAIVGMGAAAELALSRREADAKRIAILRDRVWKGICAGLERVHLNGHSTERLPGNLNVSFEGVPSEAFLMAARDLAAGSGAACASGSGLPSHVLAAMGLEESVVRSSIRFGLGREMTDQEADYLVKRAVEVVQDLRQLAQGMDKGESGLRPEGVRS